MAGSSFVEGVLIDWVQSPVEPEWRLPVSWLDDAEVAAELGRIQRNRAREAAREARLIRRLAELRPDVDDPPPGAPGARRRDWRKTEPELPGVSEFFPAKLAHALNLGRGTAAFRARRAWTWSESLPATFAALERGDIDERRAGVLADALESTRPELARQVEARVLPGAEDLSLAELRRRALAALAELDAEAIGQRHEEARRAADVRTYDTGDGMATLAGDMPAEEAAACAAVLDALAQMAKADGDPRPIGAIRAAMMSMLIRRPAVHGRLDHPDGGSLTFALTDERGRPLATVTAAELARAAARGCPDHPDTTQRQGEDQGERADAGCDLRPRLELSPGSRRHPARDQPVGRHPHHRPPGLRPPPLEPPPDDPADAPRSDLIQAAVDPPHGREPEASCRMRGRRATVTGHDDAQQRDRRTPGRSAPVGGDRRLRGRRGGSRRPARLVPRSGRRPGDGAAAGLPDRHRSALRPRVAGAAGGGRLPGRRRRARRAG
jgi:hypothetical protein